MSKDVYEELGTDRRVFREIVLGRLVWSMPEEYAARIADRISDLVAQDVRERTSHVYWRYGDVACGIGRVLIKKLGLEV